MISCAFISECKEGGNQRSARTGFFGFLEHFLDFIDPCRLGIMWFQYGIVSGLKKRTKRLKAGYNLENFIGLIPSNKDLLNF